MLRILPYYHFTIVVIYNNNNFNLSLAKYNAKKLIQ